MTKLYGESSADLEAKHRQTCRDIVRAIYDHGVTQHQMLLIIELLAFELENVQTMHEIIDAARRARGGIEGTETSIKQGRLIT